MGDVLLKVATEKESSDESNNRLICGASSMQGWRKSQEDAYNAILDYDTDTSFFAVYDGHRGAEVADYCSKKLPEFIKNTQEYKEGKIEDALISGFLGFDALIKTPEVVEVLTSKAREVRKITMIRKKIDEKKEKRRREKYLEKNKKETNKVSGNTSLNLVNPRVNGEEVISEKEIQGIIGSDNCLETENKPKKDEATHNEETLTPKVESGIIDKDATTSKDEEKKSSDIPDDDDDDDENVTFDEDDSKRLENFLKKHPCGFDSGCTAVVALLRGNKLYVANVGDSCCFVCRNGKAIDMSYDHKPNHQNEYQRIEKAGGKVKGNRVDGNLNMSRAIGDHKYKQNIKLSEREQKIIALPEIRTLTIDPNEDEFMVLECDGISNLMSNQKVVDFVRPKIDDGRTKLSTICEELFDKLLPPRGGWWSFQAGDNMTTVIVKFKSNTKRSLSLDDEVKQKKIETEGKHQTNTD